MTISTLADFADLLAALGVIGSLLFLAMELRRGNRDTRQSNWRELLDGYRAFKALTNDLEFAAFLIRARENYETLSAAEKLSFGQYQEQGIHVMSNFFKHGDVMPTELAGLESAVRVCLIEHLESPGARTWYEDNKKRGRLMPGTYARIDQIFEDAGMR